MTTRPIIFSTPMVQALLAGRKTQTRRLASSPLRRVDVGDLLWVREAWAHYQTINHIRRQSGAAFDEVSDGLAGYRADGHETIHGFREHVRLMSGCDLEAVVVKGDCWRPSIHMPRWASRLTLEVTEVRRSDLWIISNSDAISEGIERVEYPGTDSRFAGDYGWKDYSDHPHAVVPFGPEYAHRSFATLWDSLHTKPGERWEDNPEIVALTFRVHHCNVDAFPSLAQVDSSKLGSGASHG